MNVARSAAATFAALALGFAVVGCATSGSTAESGGTVTVGIVAAGPPPWLMYEPLIQTVAGDPIDFVPALAVDWEINEEATSVTVELRDDVLFSDGSVLDAELVARNYEVRSDVWALVGVTHLDVDGPLTVTLGFDGSKSREQVLKNIGFPGIMGNAALDDPDSQADGVAGSGPYLMDLERTALDQEYVFVPNPDYWNPEQFVWDEYVVKLFADQVALLNALKSGQVDIGGPIEHNYGGEAEASGLVVDQTNQSFAAIYIVDRIGKLVPALGDVRVRRAMNMAFDREAIVEALQNGYGEPANQPWGPGWPAYRADLDDRYPFDPDAARELMAEAGYADGFDLELQSFGSQYEPIVQQSLAEIGIRVDYVAATADEFLTKGAAGEIPAFINFGPFGPMLYEGMETNFVPSGGYWNSIAADDPYVDELMQAYSFGDETERREAAASLGEYVLDQAWFVVLTTYPALWAHTAEFEVPPHPVAPTQSPDWLGIRPAE